MDTSKKNQSPLEKIRRSKIEQRHSDQIAIQTASKQSPQALQKLRNQLQQKNSLFGKDCFGTKEQKQQVIENVINQFHKHCHSNHHLKLDISKIIKCARKNK